MCLTFSVITRLARVFWTHNISRTNDTLQGVTAIRARVESNRRFGLLQRVREFCFHIGERLFTIMQDDPKARRINSIYVPTIDTRSRRRIRVREKLFISNAMSSTVLSFDATTPRCNIACNQNTRGGTSRETESFEFPRFSILLSRKDLRILRSRESHRPGSRERKDHARGKMIKRRSYDVVVAEPEMLL